MIYNWRNCLYETAVCNGPAWKQVEIRAPLKNGKGFSGNREQLLKHIYDSKVYYSPQKIVGNKPPKGFIPYDAVK